MDTFWHPTLRSAADCTACNAAPRSWRSMCPWPSGSNARKAAEYSGLSSRAAFEAGSSGRRASAQEAAAQGGERGAPRLPCPGAPTLQGDAEKEVGHTHTHTHTMGPECAS